MDWITQFLPDTAAFTGSTGFWFFMSLVVTLYFAWKVITYSKAEVFELPFGIKYKSRAEKNIESDINVIEGIHETSQFLEYEARQRMREQMFKAVAKYTGLYPEMKMIIIQGRIAISTAITDNHIVYSLTDTRVTDYISDKQDAVIAATCEELTDGQKDILRAMTAEFILNIIAIQERLSDAKITAYERAMNLLISDGQKNLCAAKIQKNKNYIEEIRNIRAAGVQSAIAADIGQLSAANTQRALATGDMLDENIKRTKNAFKEYTSEKHNSGLHMIAPAKQEKKDVTAGGQSNK
jgi:hypothetical protein